MRPPPVLGRPVSAPPRLLCLVAAVAGAARAGGGEVEVGPEDVEAVREALAAVGPAAGTAGAGDGGPPAAEAAGAAAAAPAVAPLPRSGAATSQAAPAVGTRVSWHRNAGTVRFTGPVGGWDGEWVGIELDTAAGRNNGRFRGVQYFQCPSRRGVFAQASQLVALGADVAGEGPS